ncbi:MAG TPA: Uma2 family endonuclease [Gemmataceae bacterium]|nr:Uma2 family endonuclease [Gemmataceae bacterium]
MATVVSPPPEPIRTLADLMERLGGVPPKRVRWRPLPGTATEKDVIEVDAHEDRLCELVDGTLVEKPMGFRESALAMSLGKWLIDFVNPRNLGIVSGESGMMRIFPGLVRIPDVAFASWKRFPNRRMPNEPIPDLAPDLVVEVLSESNTEQEMARKYREYFQAGVRLVWEVDPKNRTVEVFTAADQSTRLNESQTLDGGNVLPGFTLSLSQLFGELDRQGNG